MNYNNFTGVSVTDFLDQQGVKSTTSFSRLFPPIFNFFILVRLLYFCFLCGKLFEIIFNRLCLDDYD